MSAADTTLAGWIGRRCERTPHRAALTYEGRTWTYLELGARIDAAACHLHGCGVGRGDRVAYLDLNNASFFVTLFAAARIGAIFVPLNFRLAAAELSYILSDAGAAVLVVGPDHREIIEGIRHELPCTTFLSADVAVPGWPALRTASPGPVPKAPVIADDVAVIMYTSGTTGRPKGAMLSHANLWWNNVNAMHAFDVLADDVTLTAMPIFHIGALNALSLVTLQKGGHVVIHRGFDPAAVLEAITGDGVTTMFCVPQGLRAISELPSFPDADLTSMRMLLCGSAPCPLPLLRLYAERGLAVVQGWGMTEASPIATFLTDEFAVHKMGSAGNAAMLCDVKLLDTEGNEVEQPMMRGEAYVRGPNVMLGYWNNPEATAAVLSEDGWFQTGDIAYRDEDGFYYIVDRAKDMILSGGENIYSSEVEQVLAEHPSIAEVAVIGQPDDRWGEQVVAVVVPRAGHRLSLEEVRAWAGQHLARYKLPKRLELTDALPRNAVNKILKTALRDRYATHDDTVAPTLPGVAE